MHRTNKANDASLPVVEIIPSLPTMPLEIQKHMFQFLTGRSYFAVGFVKKRFSENDFWVNFYRRDFGPITLITLTSSEQAANDQKAKEKKARESNAKLQYIAAFLLQSMRDATLPHRAQLYYLKLREFLALHANQPWANAFLGAALFYHAPAPEKFTGIALLVKCFNEGEHRAGVELANIILNEHLAPPAHDILTKHGAWLFVKLQALLSDLYEKHGVKSAALLLAKLHSNELYIGLVGNTSVVERKKWLYRALDAGHAEVVEQILEFESDRTAEENNNDELDGHWLGANPPDAQDNQELVLKSVEDMNQQNLTILEELLSRQHLSEKVKAEIYFLIGKFRVLTDKHDLAISAYIEASKYNHVNAILKLGNNEALRAAKFNDPETKSKHRLAACDHFERALFLQCPFAIDKLAHLKLYATDGQPEDIIKLLKSAYTRGNRHAVFAIVKRYTKQLSWWNDPQKVLWVQLAAQGCTSETNAWLTLLKTFSQQDQYVPLACIAHGILNAFGIKSFLSPDPEKAAQYFKRALELDPKSIETYLKAWLELGIECKDIVNLLSNDVPKLIALHASTPTNNSRP